MEYLARVNQFLEHHHASVSRDQFFLIDPSVGQQLIKVAGITADDRVLEVGPGLGFITELLAAQAESVLAIELDKRLKPWLKSLPTNVEVVWGDAYRLLNDPVFQQNHRPPTKTVSSVPYSQAQNMLHNYTNWPWYQGDVVWLAPSSFAQRVNEEPILGAYFEAEMITEVPKTAFYPQPNTMSAIIYLHRIPDPMSTKRFDLWFRRWLYNHEDRKVRNALREGIIEGFRVFYQQRVTKKQAMEMIAYLDLPASQLEKLTNNLRPEYYFSIPEKIIKQMEN